LPTLSRRLNFSMRQPADSCVAFRARIFHTRAGVPLGSQHGNALYLREIFEKREVFCESP
jgi:hypothetical protein